MSKVYTLDEVARQLRFTKPYVKMNLKKFPEYHDDESIPEELVAKLAMMLHRTWPPDADPGPQAA